MFLIYLITRIFSIKTCHVLSETAFEKIRLPALTRLKHEIIFVLRLSD